MPVFAEFLKRSEDDSCIRDRFAIKSSRMDKRGLFELEPLDQPDQPGSVGFNTMSMYFLILIVPVLLGIGILLILLGYAVLGANSSDIFANLFQGGTKLTCWHCGQETRADLKTCQHCENELQ